MPIFVDGPMRPPRCACGSTEFEVSEGDGWAIVRFQTLPDGELTMSGRLPVRVLACRECMCLTFQAFLVPTDSP